MRIANEDELAIRPIQTDSEIDIPRSAIIVNGELSDKIVLGSVLEAVIHWNDLYLLFLTYYVPYENTLNIHLLDKDLNLLDSVMLGSIYPTESFSSLQLLKPNKINFRFIGGKDWKIELLPKPVFSIPFFSDPIGVSRKFSFKKRFTISSNPVPKQK